MAKVLDMAQNTIECGQQSPALLDGGTGETAGLGRSDRLPHLSKCLLCVGKVLIEEICCGRQWASDSLARLVVRVYA